MHSVDLLEEALKLAQEVGFDVRREWLGEATGGACRVGDKWVLSADLSLTAEEQLQQVTAALRNSHLLPAELHVSRQLQSILSGRRQA